MKRKTTNYLVILTAVAAMFLISTPLRAADTDDQIVTLIENSYVFKTYLKDDAIKTNAKDGVVTLTGTVTEEDHKTLAQETAANVYGVTKVDNQLMTKSEVATENADTWISRKVKLVLLFHLKVNGFKTAVTVEDGIVTLKGEASTIAQKELTTEYANDIDGVKMVNNEMTVAAIPVSEDQTLGEKIDDASITAQVKTALLTHRSTSAIKTKVVTKDGEVLLTGVAKNSTEITLVTKLVSDIRGVTKVKNQMTVEKTKTK